MPECGAHGNSLPGVPRGGRRLCDRRAASGHPCGGPFSHRRCTRSAAATPTGPRSARRAFQVQQPCPSTAGSTGPCPGTLGAPCQRKIEMSYSPQNRNVRFCQGGARMRVSLAVPVKRRRAIAGEQPDQGIAGRNSSRTMSGARSFRRVLLLGLGCRPTGGGTPPPGQDGLGTPSDR
jgi:hypothetical protein